MLQTTYKVLDAGYKKFPSNSLFPIIKERVSRHIEHKPELMDLYLAISQESSIEFEKTATLSDKTDHRIMHLMVSSFKAFCKSDNMYGVDFRDAKHKTTPASTVILGSNGIGKTSLYTALEMASMQHCYVGEVYGYRNSSEQLNYVRNSKEKNEQPLVTMVDYSSNEISYPGRHGELCPRAFFCSQFDIQEYLAGEHNDDYILSQLGRSNLLHLKRFMDEIELITKKMNNALMLKNSLKKKTLSKEQKKQLTDEIKTVRNEIKIKLGLPKLRLIQLEWASDERTEEVVQVAQAIRDEIDRTFKEYLRVSTRIIPLLLDSYLSVDNVKVVVDADSKKPMLIGYGKYEKENPKLLLNTFRMKLFIIAIKMSFAFTSKIINKINFPIVLDDVFDSSDFNNKYEIRRFFQSIVGGHDEDDILKQLPIQIICFTQDRLIGDNVYQGILCTSHESPVKYCRMFHYLEANNEDKVLAIGSVDYLNVTQVISSSI